nr:hypothetical protein [Tanacetum cinerariifolium]
ALEITPIDSAHPFELPPAGEQVMDFVNELGYPEEIHFVSKMHVNNLYQPWRAILSLINQCLTGKTSGNDKPRHPDNLNIPTKKPTPHIIPYCRDDFLLGNLKFVPKGKKDKVFGKPILKTKHVKEKTSKLSHSEKICKRKVMKVCKGKRTDYLVDEEDEEPQTDLQKPKKQSTTDQYIFQRWIPITQDASTRPSIQPQDDTFANVSRPPPEHVIMEEDQAGSNPGQSHVVLAGLNPIPMHEDFVATVDSQVHESLKHTTEEHVHIENPLSSSVTLLLMKNLDDPLTFGDQFLNEKLTEDEPGKANVEIKVESMVIVPIHQASSSAPPLSTPIIDLTPPKPVSPPAQEPIFTATTTTTTFLPPPPPQQQSTTVPELATRVFALENICANFKKKHKLQVKTTQALLFRVFALEIYDLYLKINNYVNKTVNEAVQNTLQDLVHERFRELSQPKHAALYDALKVSMDRKNREEFIEATAKSRKRHRDNQDPPPPPPKDLDQNKKKRNDSDASALKQPPLQKPSA